MKLDEVPQDGLPYKDRDKLRKLMYATSTDGQYTSTTSAGWEAENAATEGAWQEVELRLAETLAGIKAGRLSPIAYYMELRLMDVSILAKYVGKWQWTVRRHLKPAVFRKLPDSVLEKYAAVFNITLAELQAPRIN